MSVEKITSAHASITKLRKDPLGTVAAGQGFPVAILKRNEPAFYCVPVEAYAALLERLDDLELNAIADAREGQAVHRVKLNVEELDPDGL